MFDLVSILRGRRVKKGEEMVQITRICWTVLAAAFLCSGLIAGGQASGADKNACSDDIAKFCKNVQADPVATLGCLEEHESELSNACKEYEAKMEGRRGEAREDAKVKMRFRYDCGADIVKFCKDVNPEQQGLVKCITEHKSDLSPSCRDWLKADNEETKVK
jgi:hypothetical protein